MTHTCKPSGLEGTAKRVVNSKASSDTQEARGQPALNQNMLKIYVFFKNEQKDNFILKSIGIKMFHVT